MDDRHDVWQGCHLTAALTGLATVKGKEIVTAPLALAGSDVNNKGGQCDH